MPVLTPTIESGDVAAIPPEAAEPTPESAWLARRSERWGASEVPTLLAWRGAIDVDRCPAYLREDLEPSRYGAGIPRFLARKAGLTARKKTGAAARRGSERERELLATWVRLLVHGEAACDVLPSTVRHADSIPHEWLPIVDRECPHLAATPDAWGRDLYTSALVAIELKCSMGHGRDERVLASVPHWEAQVHAEIAALGAASGVLVIGSGWALDRGDGIDGPVRTHEIERDEARIAVIREVCADAWSAVERLRERRQG